jgi:hydrogenase large subunit
VQDRLKGFVEAGQLGIFANGYWGHPAMRLPPEVNLLAVSHYLQALEYQRKAHQIVAVLGSKTPHIQNLTVGGVANAINLDNQSTLNIDRLYLIKSLFDEVTAFVQQVYVPDACAVASFYPEWLGYGAGVTNYLAVPDLPTDAKATTFDLPGGVILDGALSGVRPITDHHNVTLIREVTENVSRAYYEGKNTRHPWEGETVPEYNGYDAAGKYSWVKAPRYDGKPMQVGPLAQVLVGYAQGHALTRKWADAALSTVSTSAKCQITPQMLQSTLGRVAARAIRCAMLSDIAIEHWQRLVDNIGRGDTAIHFVPQFPKGEIRGVGFHEAPRDTLSHWVVIENGRITNYQVVVPTTWNASPRDERGVPGPYEASLAGNPVADPEQPLEMLRTVHSFDPCLACAVHTLDPEGRELSRIEAL